MVLCCQLIIIIKNNAIKTNCCYLASTLPIFILNRGGSGTDACTQTIFRNFSSTISE